MSNYKLLLAPDGNLLRSDLDGLRLCSLADDACMWRGDDQSLSSVSDSELTVTVAESAVNFSNPELGDGRFTVVQGPTKLPSEHLEELRTQGYTILENVLDEVAIGRIKKQMSENRAHFHQEELPHDGHFWMISGLCWCPDLARSASHPVALWLFQEYLKTTNIHFCHQPVITTLKPAKNLLGTHPVGGWHSDYPYHNGVFPNDEWPENPVYGIQYNVCVDDFRDETGATQFVPGSHSWCRPPSEEFNDTGNLMGQGVHKDVKQMTASAGAALIYDARTWHRACHELNVSGKDRVAFLNAVAPAWVRPMTDKTFLVEDYKQSEVPSLLTEREKGEIDRLCVKPTLPTPEDRPTLSERISQNRLR